jgi:hypothetical protein
LREGGVLSAEVLFELRGGEVQTRCETPQELAGCMIGWKLSSIACPALALLGSEMANGNTIIKTPTTMIGQ